MVGLKGVFVPPKLISKISRFALGLVSSVTETVKEIGSPSFIITSLIPAITGAVSLAGAVISN